MQLMIGFPNLQCNKSGMKIEDIYSLTKINPFFLNKILNIVDWEKK